MVAGYRNGKPYGNPYRTDRQIFGNEKTQVVFGIRHGTSFRRGRMLHGRILDATLYDRALTPEEVLSSVKGNNGYVSKAMMLAAMTPAQKQRLEELNQLIRSREVELASLGKPVLANQAYADLVLSIFNMKEFIYVR